MTIERIESWLLETAFPFWAERGVDRGGPGFVEHLALDGHPADVPFKRVRVQARQIYCFCQAAELGWAGDPLGLAGRGVELLIDRAWHGPDRGWASVLTRSGAVRDATPDLYDIAFVLFGLGWWYRTTGDARVVGLAGQTLDFLATHMRHPSGEGYLHRLGGATPHLQNPHMHLAEAMIVLRDATGVERFAAEADRMVDLCLDHFYEPASGTLAEQFSADWIPLPGPSGLRLEPGHHYEWVWLLGQHAKGGGSRRAEGADAMRGLFDFTIRHGQRGPSDLVVDGVLPTGAIVAPDHRLWPQAERLKAWIAMAEHHSVAIQAPVTAGIEAIFAHYLDTVPPGTWVESRDPALHPKADQIPASSFYHVVLAFAEVLRCRTILAGDGA